MALTPAQLGAQLGEFASLFGNVAISDPLSGLLLAIGALLTGISVGVGGYLALGAFVEALTGTPG